MKVVIVGGGYAGIKAALELSGVAEFEVELICPRDEFIQHTSSSSLAMGSGTAVRIADIITGSTNITLVHDEIVALNAKVKAVKGRSGHIYGYDRLLLCIGTDKGSFSVPGVVEYAHHVYQSASTVSLQSTLTSLFRIPHRSKVRIIVVGGGLTGVELAGSISGFSKTISVRYGIAPKKVHVELISFSLRLLPELSEAASALAAKRLSTQGVVMTLGRSVRSVSQNSVQCGNDEKAADVIIWAGGTSINTLFTKYPEVFELSNSKVKVNERFQVPRATDIYVLGDSIATQYSGMAISAIAHADRVAHTLLGEVGIKANKLSPMKSPLYFVPIGERWAIVQHGKKVYGGRRGWMMRKSSASKLAKSMSTRKLKNSKGR